MAEYTMPSPLSIGADKSNRVQAIFRSRGLTLHRVSRESLRIFESNAAYRIPHNLYSLLHDAEFIPSLQQLCALSRITGYELADWMLVFGIELVMIPQLQAVLPSKRTKLIDFSPFNTLVIPETSYDSQIGPDSHRIALSEDQLRAGARPDYGERHAVGEVAGSLYAKIGVEDALAFPDLLPGSIVRLNPYSSLPLRSASAGPHGKLHLVEHGKGIWCSRLAVGEDGRIRPTGNLLAFGNPEFRVPTEARILGMVDMEIRWLNGFLDPKVPSEFARSWQPTALYPPDSKPGSGSRLGEFVRSARLRAGLTFRAASALSRRIADYLSNDRYFAASGTLSDYEVRNAPPRNVEKVVSLCILYGIPFSNFLMAIGLEPQEVGHDPVPQDILRSRVEIVGQKKVSNRFSQGYDGDPSAQTDSFGDLPSGLIEALFELSGIPRPTSRDIYRLGPESEILIPYSGDNVLTLVNRQRKSPVRHSSKPKWQQPVYLLRRRNGRFICGPCGLDKDLLTVYPDSQDPRPTIRLWNGRDAEVVGQVVAIVRRIF